MPRRGENSYKPSALSDARPAWAYGFPQHKQKYRNQLRRMNDPEREKELKEQAKAISAELKPLREDLRMAKRIEEKYPQLQQLLETERDMETRVRTRERERGYER